MLLVLNVCMPFKNKTKVLGSGLYLKRQVLIPESSNPVNILGYYYEQNCLFVNNIVK